MRRPAAGGILLAAAPCTAMVWSNLTKGEPHLMLSQVALNDTIMAFAFAPIVGQPVRPVGDHRNWPISARMTGGRFTHCPFARPMFKVAALRRMIPGSCAFVQCRMLAWRVTRSI
jgi:hypothetical protein